MNDGNSSRGIRLGAVIAVVAVAAFLVWYVAIRDSGNSSTPVDLPAGSKPVEVSESDLSSLSDQIDQPIYWAGEQPDSRLELTRFKNGRIYVRYLTGDAKVGDPKRSFLTVGTYPFQDAYSAVEALSQEAGATVEHVGDSGLAVAEAKAPTSVYFAQQGENVEVEVYDPDAAKAIDLVTSGAVQPVG